MEIPPSSMCESFRYLLATAGVDGVLQAERATKLPEFPSCCAVFRRLDLACC